MPLPTPHANEDQDTFIARCMRDPETQAITGDSDQETRERQVAACFRQWREKKSPTDDLSVKSFGALEIKDAEKGEVEAVVATLGVVDKDFEIIAQGAIKNGAKVKLSAYGHDAVWGATPVGKGALHLDGDKVMFRGRFFRSTSRGAEAFQTVKEMGSDQEWSFAFRVVKAEDPDDEHRSMGARRILLKLDPFEVSPVITAAGIGTHTVAVKCDGCGAEHEGEICEPCQAKAAKAAAKEQAACEALAMKESEELARRAAEEFARFEQTRKRLGG